MNSIMSELTAVTKRLPSVAKMRKETADELRRARRENPAVVRLLCRRLREAEISMIEVFWSPPETALSRFLSTPPEQRQKGAIRAAMFSFD